MKKAKIILTAMAVFATIGGALAFKAEKATYGSTIYTGSSATECTVTRQNVTITSENPGTAKTFATTVFDGSGCKLEWTIQNP